MVLVMGIQKFKTRIAMLSLLPKNGRGCELGTFKGDFAEIIIGVCEPKELILVDVWPPQVNSGDVNGNNVELLDGSKLRHHVFDRFKHQPEVTPVHSMTVDALNNIPDNSLDYVYIDADHRYEGVLEDITLSYQKVKNGGYIMGHDYEMNPAKTDNHYEFGVKKAVDEFCKEYKQKICAKAYDGCVSYAIKVKKR